jgi:hypothetical protein
MASSNEGPSKGLWNRRNFLATSMVSTMSVTFLDRSPANAAPAAHRTFTLPTRRPSMLMDNDIILRSTSVRRCSTPCATISV